MSTEGREDEVKLPVIQTMYVTAEDCSLIVNDRGDIVQRVARAIGKDLMMFVDDEGVVVRLKGTSDEISKASFEFSGRLQRIGKFLSKR